MPAKLELSVFISSPGDVAEERALAARVFRRLTSEFADVVTLRIILWEHEPLFAHTGFQEQIQRPSQCDLVVSILWSRLGTRLPADYSLEPGRPPPTGTEFEVRDALTAFEKYGRPNLLIYRKRAPPHVDMAGADADERFRQYKQLTEFCRTAFYDAQGAVLVAHHSFADGADFERRLSEHARKWIVRELETAGEHRALPRWTHGSPFRGLQPFDAEHQDVFFGRSQAVGELLRRLRDVEAAGREAKENSRLLLIVGMSGNGKTSLVRAGLLPFLTDLPIEGIAAWYTTSVRPSDADGSAPTEGVFGALAARLAELFPRPFKFGLTIPELAAALRTEPASAVARIDTYIAAEAEHKKLERRQVRLLVYVDQLEELFTLPSVANQASAFCGVLAALAALPTVWVVATLRTDFVHRLEAYPAIMDMLRRNTPYTLLAPKGDELSDMIREPAIAAGLEFEERDGVSLDRELLRDATANPESLPLLQYALQQLYDRRAGRSLLWDVYRPAGREGGLRASLVAVAEAVLANADNAAGTAFRRVLRELTSVGEDGSATRRYAAVEAFAAASDERSLVERLVSARLAVTDRHGDQPVVFLAHEALLQSWPRVQSWLLQESALLRLRDELQRDAHVWETHGRSDSWLGTEADKLAGLRQLEREGMVPAEAAGYADRSRRRARHNNILKNGAIACICTLGLVSIVAFVIAAKQRDRARAEAVTADRTSRFMVDLFKLADPGEGRGNSVTVREVLDRGAADVGHGLEHEPQVRADLLTAMGEAYTGLGLYEPAKKLLEQARSDQDTVAVAPESRIRTLTASGALLDDAADYDNARTLLERAVTLAQAQLASDSALTSEARDDLADVLTQLERFDEAERLCLAALAVDRRRGADGAVMLSKTLNTLALAYYSNGKLADAEGPMREALALRQQNLGPRHALTAESMNDVGSLLYQAGRYTEAAAMWEQTLPIFREVYGPEHPAVSALLNNLGRSALMAGRAREAIPLLEQSLALDEKEKDPMHDDLVQPLNSLGMAYLSEGNAARAAIDIDRALRIARLRDHALLDQVLVNKADLELYLNKTAGVESLLAEAHQRLQSRYPLAKGPAEAWRYAVWESVDAALLAQQANPAQARELFARARKVLLQRFGAKSFYVARLDQRASAVEQKSPRR